MGETSYDVVSPKKKEGSQCTRRTIIEICVAVILIGIIIYFIYNNIYSNSKDSSNSHCEYPECYKFLLELEELLDKSVDPCQDFHQFVCGKYYTTSFIKGVSDPLTFKLDQVAREMESFVVTPIQEHDSQRVSLQKTVFQSCVDTDKIDEDENQTFLKLIAEIGGWPLLEGTRWKEEEFDWKSAMMKCSQLGLPFQWFLKLGVHVANDTNYFFISHPDKSDGIYNKKYVESVVKALRKNVTILPKEIDKLFMFERKLALLLKHPTSGVELQSVQYLQMMFPKYEWLDILTNITDENMELDENTTVAFNIDPYIHALDNLIIGTDKRAVANYIGWTIFQKFGLLLSSEIRNIYREFTKAEYTRHDFCVTFTRDLFPYVSEAEYIIQHSDDESKQSAKELTETIRDEIMSRVEDAWRKNEGWLNNASSKYYIDKFKETTIDIGGQKEIFSDVLLDGYYLRIGSLYFDDLNSNIIDLVRERFKYQHKWTFISVGKEGLIPEDIVGNSRNVETVNFDMDQNRLVVPASLLHGLFHESDRPKYTNYGALGSVIGGELVKGFLNELKEDDNYFKLWRHSDYKVFEDGSACFENDLQKQISANASQVIQEIISDVIGRNLAYSAYQKWAERNEEELLLPFQPYNAKQLFWITSSLINCHQQPTDMNEPESIIPRYRNILSLRHSPNFAADFDCPVGSHMNPRKAAKCWLFL